MPVTVVGVLPLVYVMLQGWFPVRATESQVSIVIDDLLNDLYQGISTDSYSLNDSIAKSLSKCLAIKTGTYLTEKEQESLVNNLFACKEPNITPFNKPTFITMRVEDLDKKFALWWISLLQ